VEVRRRQAGTEKAAQLLGFRTTFTLEDGLKQLIEWRQPNRAMTVAMVG
jgi:nucleoside-diphosphate-sugar epimerase